MTLRNSDKIAPLTPSMPITTNTSTMSLLIVRVASTYSTPRTAMRLVPSVSSTHSSLIPKPVSSSQIVRFAPPRMKTFLTSGTPRSLRLDNILFSRRLRNTSSSCPISTWSSSKNGTGFPSSSTAPAWPILIGTSLTILTRTIKSSALSSVTRTFKSLPYSFRTSSTISFILSCLSKKTVWFSSKRRTHGDRRRRSSSVSSLIS
mmetsp:Transcript_15891/g.32608  ORF Transcript_15891/g.32608 Transcript_15891/m.32608 type:complete len:204 (+) Transcript_15891:1310-1921(+)